ncbi:plasmid stabilization system [Nitrosococcus halophilus Nc 4]|uniref:Plasmid stabilization system n=1 Tax=Nitrosococcus halophilus (strain Nc4) TaxID=472759 RepID=D5C0T1_NITHN|nr:type II toxin-antitoxin system RelE/ParE family toxin [Nitrosococcus halophilus]ADE16404.1 plasmid stabilization system [Nitrosococcus halophilus Nc 4]
MRCCTVLTGLFTKLADFPRIGLSCEELAPGLLSFPVGHYLVFYLETSDGIEVVRVLHGARDIPAILEEPAR